MLRQRQLNEDAVHAFVWLSCSISWRTLLGSRLRGQTVVVALDACFQRSPVLVVDVDVRRGIVADEHRRQADLPELGDVPGHLGADTRRGRHLS